MTIWNMTAIIQASATGTICIPWELTNDRVLPHLALTSLSSKASTKNATTAHHAVWHSRCQDIRRAAGHALLLLLLRKRRCVSERLRQCGIGIVHVHKLRQATWVVRSLQNITSTKGCCHAHDYIGQELQPSCSSRPFPVNKTYRQPHNPLETSLQALQRAGHPRRRNATGYPHSTG